ncbi:MAG: Uma2 family endonuclease [Deinococcota bacterium]
MYNVADKTLTVEDYLAFEAASETRHEYVSGTLHAMAGDTRQQNRIAGNISVHFWNLAQEKPCFVYQEGMKLRASETVFYYPDVMVTCNKPEPDPYFDTEPCILVEVLSRSTKDIDLREKLVAYQSLPSVQLYLIVDSERLAIKEYYRDADGVWQYQELTGSGDINLPCLGGTLSLQQIYRNIF